MNNQYQLKQFNDMYEKLNPQQKLAVDTIEGPVMVIAGPGTGKTQILSARIGKILLETDTQPGNILCLTYTEAGVVAMRRRLSTFIGPDAYRVNIHTFHAFCNEVIQENLHLFEKISLDPVSELERVKFFKELIDGFPKDHPLKRYRGEVYFEIDKLKSLFSSMKMEGWTPAYINQKIDDYLQDLPNRDDFVYKRKYKLFNAGDPRADKIREETERMEKLRAAVKEFDRFQQLMRSHNRYDFDDMITWVVRAFEENENLVRRYQEQFLYILVDEYQDTSGIQSRLVNLLISYWDKPNIFVVGDDDQSIYRFQGANLENMLSFSNYYKDDLLTVILTDNYRSTQPILEVSKTLIERNEERLVRQIKGLSKDLQSRGVKLNTPATQPVFKEYQNPSQEMIGIVRELTELIEQGVAPAKIAVIYKENKYGDALTQYCRLRNIPIHTKRSVNILAVPIAQKIILLLKWLSTELDIPYSGDEMLFEILHFDWFGIPPIEIAKLSIEVAGRKFNDNKTSIRQLLSEKSTELPKDLFSTGLRQELKTASKVLENLIAAVPNLTLQGLFEQIVRETGVLRIIMQNPEKAWLMDLLTGLFDFIKEESRRNPFLGLEELVTIIELMEKEEISIPLVQVSGSDKAVNLLTAHGSKGLEFEHVFFAGCNAAVWEKKQKPQNKYKLPDTLHSSRGTEFGQSTDLRGYFSDDKKIEEEEYRRLFYVVLTRAKQHLTISFSRFREDGKEIEPSLFVAEILEKHEFKVQQIFVDNEIITGFQSLLFAKQAPEIERMEEELVERLLDKFVMNVTALNNYLKCPLEFYFKNLVRIPSPKNEATEFGSAVHYALEQLFRKMQVTGDQFPPKETLLADFDWYMLRHRESFTREQFERRKEYGHIVLPNYYDKYVNSWNKIVAIERNIRNVVVQGVPLKGKLDKLEFEGKLVNVVDYKTGDPEKAKSKLSPPSEKEPIGGDYWRQGVFYKILIDQNERGWQVVSTEFDFIEPDNKKNYRKEKLLISTLETGIVTQQITDTWAKIQQHEFYTGCGKEDCHWCNFVKTNHLEIALHELNEEEA
jgi:DNA helicase II / ATP-dependent DNA helicase PcrA